MKTLSDTQIGLAVKSARRASGLSAKQLAERSDLSATALSKIESGKQSINFAQAFSVCFVLGIRVDHLAALAHEIEPIAAETASIRDRLKHDLHELEQQTIRTAIAVRAAQRDPVPA